MADRPGQLRNGVSNPGDEAGPSDSDATYSVRSLARGLSILRSFTVERPEWGVTELSRHLELNKATIFRLAKTLEAEGFLSFEPSTGKYHVGSALLRVAYVGLSRAEIVQVARPYMEKAASETGESVDLAVWTNEGVLFVDQVRTSRPFRPMSRIGRVFSDFKNAHAKVFLAFMPDEERSQNLELAPSPVKLSRELEKVAAEGVAYDVQEHAEGVCSVAAPILDTSGRARASISIVTPASRFGSADVIRLTQAVREAALGISRELGFD